MESDGHSAPAGIALDLLQDYIEGRLDDATRARIEAYLRSKPEIARQIDTLQSQAARTKALGNDILREPVPDTLLQTLRKLQAKG